jgi:hypothetical protein
MKYDFSDLKRRMILKRSSAKEIQEEDEVATIKVVEEAKAEETIASHNSKQQRRM